MNTETKAWIFIWKACVVSFSFLVILVGLNEKLKRLDDAPTIIAFIILPASTNNYNINTLKGHSIVKNLKEALDTVTSKLKERMLDSCLRGNSLELELSNEDAILLKRHMNTMKRQELPPIVTHNMVDDVNDPVLKNLRRLCLYNNESDRVKIIFHPEFLSSDNPILGMDYEEFVRGCHLGVFPSYYEPWGYTPAECTAMGIPSITTNLSGYGCYMEDNVEHPADHGIYIVDRRSKSVEESIQQLTQYMLDFCKKSQRQRITLRNRTERLGKLLDWGTLGIEYRKARKLACLRKYTF